LQLIFIVCSYAMRQKAAGWHFTTLADVARAPSGIEAADRLVLEERVAFHGEMQAIVVRDGTARGNVHCEDLHGLAAATVAGDHRVVKERTVFNG
jgi:hypothetical protein